MAGNSLPGGEVAANSHLLRSHRALSPHLARVFGVRILVTGVTGYVGAAVAPRLLAAGHEVVGYARTPSRVVLDIPVVQGDAVEGTGLDEALEGAQVAYYLIHSMEPG